jgi:hypothetical protein
MVASILTSGRAVDAGARRAPRARTAAISVARDSEAPPLPSVVVLVSGPPRYLLDIAGPRRPTRVRCSRRARARRPRIRHGRAQGTRQPREPSRARGSPWRSLPTDGRALADITRATATTSSKNGELAAPARDADEPADARGDVDREQRRGGEVAAPPWTERKTRGSPDIDGDDARRQAARMSPTCTSCTPRARMTAMCPPRSLARKMATDDRRGHSGRRGRRATGP